MNKATTFVLAALGVLVLVAIVVAVTVLTTVLGGVSEMGSTMMSKFQLFGAASMGIMVMAGGMLGMVYCVIPFMVVGVFFNQIATGVARYQAVQGRNQRLAPRGNAQDAPAATGPTAAVTAATSAAEASANAAVAAHAADLAAERDAEASEDALNSIIGDTTRDPLDAALSGADLEDPEFAGLMVAGS